jgi:hypothetical protein
MRRSDRKEAARKSVMVARKIRSTTAMRRRVKPVGTDSRPDASEPSTFVTSELMV